MRLILLFIFLLFINTLNAKEVFMKDNILKYLNLDNSFVYVAVGEKYVYKQRENYQRGNFDTKIVASYDKKDYPLGNAEFLSAGLLQPIENGMEFSLNYRRAEGVQEYNNIKTGNDGEIIVGVTIPIFSVGNDINKRKLDFYSAKIDTYTMNYKAQDNLRLLYFNILSSYYKLLYYNQSNILILKLLNNAQKRVLIIKKRVDAGSLAELSYLEARQQIINRKQRLLSAKNKYKNALSTFVKYLNIDTYYFNSNYILPSIMDLQNDYIAGEISFETAKENRPDLKVFINEIKKLNLKNKFTAVSKYPNLNLGLYGVHDFEYEEGFKVTLGMDFPIQRNKYESKKLELKNSIKNIHNKKEKKLITIKTNLQIIENSINTIVDNIQNSKIEVSLVEQLESAENKKYKVGLSNLFMVNQREIYTLQIKKKLLKYSLDYLLLQQELDKVMGRSLDINLR